MVDVSSESRKVSLDFCKENLHMTVKLEGKAWDWKSDYRPYMESKQGKIYFSDAIEINTHPWITGIGNGVRTSYKGFEVQGKAVPFEFETIVWIENSTNDVFFELIPVCEEGIDIEAIYWPGPMEFSEINHKWYTLLNLRQGLLIPNDWPNAIDKIILNAQLCSTASCMPWWGQVKDSEGYIAICKTPWDAAYKVDKIPGGALHIGVKWLPSLGKISYKREMRFTFRENCDYNDLCKIYRAYVKENGLFVTLKEKAAKNPLVDKLIGSAIVHKGIKRHVVEESRQYNKEDLSKNDELIQFAHRTEQMKKLKEAGVDKVYFHLDGWGDPGYDNKHPDYLPPCVEAGGTKAMKELSDTMKDLNYMFGIHDQYRDYYFDAPTFDKNFAVTNMDGTVPENTYWDGGHQTFLCASQAQHYVKRNFEELFKAGIHLEGTYLDVFTCNELDECNHKWHKMTRKQCAEYRKSCFDYLTARGILPSSEEVVDWAMESLVFCHYAPYDFMLEKPDAPKKGISVPLLNLVYHDCLIIPWLMRSFDEKEDYKLYALLNGGAAYLDCDKEGDELHLEIERYREVAQLQGWVAKCEMTKHEFLDDTYKKQKTTFSDGTEVTIDLEKNSYYIKYR